MAFKKRTFIGKGKVHLAKYGVKAPLLPIGNVSELSFNIEENKVAVEDFTEAGGGEYDSIRRIGAVGLALTKWDVLDPSNLARATRGLASAQTSLVAIVDEPHVAYASGIIPLARIPDHGKALTVAEAAGTGTYAEGSSWRRTISGIEVIEEGPLADDAAAALALNPNAPLQIEIGYTPLASDTVEALKTSGDKYRLFVEGLNEADSDLPVLIDVHQYRPGVAQNLGWFGSEFMSMQTAGDVLKDTSIVGDALSKYFRVRAARPAA